MTYGANVDLWLLRQGSGLVAHAFSTNAYELGRINDEEFNKF
jgi:hypothetical protein